ncbi:MAG: A/G-specific adenine glycosylase [Lachnospiraceae bacterium]|nr:A/G-specific adenine glycosylase [Lachnospiraceae bacterium]
MKYHNIKEGVFLKRPNRFIAYAEIDGKQETVHVKNTGRCGELLTDRAVVYLEKSNNPNRSTAYDLVAVEKNGRIINMDSQAPNRAVGEWLKKGGLFTDLLLVRPETKFGNSRFDFYVETSDKKIFIEVKGVTLEQDNVVLFPDAPSERALKHVAELMAAKEKGYEVYVLFVVQMDGVKYFTPNRITQPEFADVLIQAKEAGVNILAYDCVVTPDSMEIQNPVEVRLAAKEQVFCCQKHSADTEISLKKTKKQNSKGKLRKGCLEDIPKPLLKWYDSNRRVLPWREEPTPYRVWVSEIMLQQTRVEAVKPYFERFMNALPDIESLARAKEDMLLKLWEGLGYYNRVRNLQKAAIQIIEEYGGEMPDCYEELLKLKGIGSYTAGAIASIAYGKKVPAVDGNVLRVVSRVAKRDEDILLPAVKKKTEEELLQIMPNRPGDFNQAMMEIGAMVCIPNGAPKCEVCPLADICLAKADGVQSEYPKKGKKKPRSIEQKTILVIRDENRTALHKRSDKGLLAGLYEFPSIEGHKTAEEVVEWLVEKGLQTLRILPLKDSTHIFTHKEWHMKGYMIRVDELAPKNEKLSKEHWIFAETAETEDKYPIPSAFAAYTEYLNIRQGNDKYRRKKE